MSSLHVLLWMAFLAFLPVSELRGAIPFGIAQGIPWYAALPFAVMVNALVAPVCRLFLSTLHRLFYGSGPGRGFAWYRSLFDRFVERAREKLKTPVERWGWLGLAVFVAIPFPATGAWTGTLGAWVLGIGKRKTFLAASLGVLISGIIVTLVTVLGIQALNVFIKK